jgi:hypothetical protein
VSMRCNQCTNLHRGGQYELQDVAELDAADPRLRDDLQPWHIWHHLQPQDTRIAPLKSARPDLVHTMARLHCCDLPQVSVPDKNVTVAAPMAAYRLSGPHFTAAGYVSAHHCKQERRHREQRAPSKAAQPEAAVDLGGVVAAAAAAAAAAVIPVVQPRRVP